MSRPLPTSALHLLHDQAARLGDRPASWSRRDGRFLPTTWRERAARVRQAALGLSRLGFGRGDCLCILSSSREEWVVAELAAMALGGVATALSTRPDAGHLAHVVRHSQARIAIAEDEEALRRLRELGPRAPDLRTLVGMDLPAPRDGALPFAEVLRSGTGGDEGPYWEAVGSLRPDQPGALDYTSGATGPPRGVLLGHRNLAWVARTLSAMWELREGEILLSHQSPSHLPERMAVIHCALAAGLQVYFVDGQKVEEELRAVRPTVFLGVPRVYEKLREHAEEHLMGLSGSRLTAARWARDVALRRNRLVLAGERVPLALEAQHQVARQTALPQLQERIGLDRARLLVTSAEPAGLDLLELFASLDLVVREVHGQTETTGFTTGSTPEATRLGMQGRPLWGVELKIALDGEILVRGPNVCLGYHREPETSAALLEGGWLGSGNLGRLDPDGYLQILGRKPAQAAARGNGRGGRPGGAQRVRAR